jgi:inosine/xanthosine triphosphate pyrophosphatase family protein
MKLLKQLRGVKGMKAAQFRACLSFMSKHGKDTSFYAYTTEWVSSEQGRTLFLVTAHSNSSGHWK